MYNGVKVLDVHSHIRWHPLATTYMNSLMSSNYQTPSPIAGGKSSERPGFTDEEWKASADRHAKYLEDRSIDFQVLGPHPVEYNGWMEPHIFKSWTSYVNDAIFKITQARPDRWTGACQLPQNAHAEDSSHMIPELERCVKEYGFVATYVTPDVTGRRDTPGMHDPYWFPLYEKCQELGIPIIVHGTDGLDPRYRVVPNNYQLAFATEQFLTVQFLRFGEQFKRFPELKIIVCHMGGGLDRFIKESPQLNPGNDTSANLFFDSCVYDYDMLQAAIAQRTVPQICFGVESPGSGGTIRPDTGKSGDHMVDTIGGLDYITEQEKIDIFHNNPARVVPGLAKAAGSTANEKKVLANA